MKKLKIYLDTSVISFLFADDAPDFKKMTNDFFENYVVPEIYIIYISDVVINEIKRTKDDIERKRLMDAVGKYCSKNILELTNEVINLANLYIKEKIIPVNKIEDAQHIAFSTLNEMDFLISWNFKHLANKNKERKVHLFNEKEGYFYPLNLTTPLGVMDED